MKFYLLTILGCLLFIGVHAQIDLDNPHFRDIVHGDDVIINGGSLCVGFDCANGENFGVSTIRLKENNLRIEFDDTSTGSFPANDWTLEANETSTGGSNHFALIDVTGSKVPFKVLAGAPTNALFIDAAGDVGIGNGNPIVELHMTDGDSPTLRLEQDGSAGFGSQTWDVAGNETNFFVRDVSNGSTLPFKIRPGAPDNMIVIDGSADRVGVGVLSPQTFFHVHKPAESFSGEDIARFRVSDDNESSLIINNGTLTNGAFSPQIQGISAKSGPALTFFGIVDDTMATSQPGILMNVRTNEYAELANRPVLDIQNDGSSFFFINPDGNIGIQTTIPTQHLEVNGNIKVKRMADKDNELGSAGQVLTPSGSQLDWVDGKSFGIYGSNGTIPSGRTVALGGSLNFDSNTFYIDGTNNRVGIGTNAPSHKLHVDGNIGLSGLVIGVSDMRLKKDIESIHDARSIIASLDGKQYQFRSKEFESLNLPIGNQFGLIAQDVEKVLSDVVYDNFISYQNDLGITTDLKGINYSAIIPVLINAMNEQDQIITKQADQIKELLSRQEEILNRLSELEK